MSVVGSFLIELNVFGWYKGENLDFHLILFLISCLVSVKEK